MGRLRSHWRVAVCGCLYFAAAYCVTRGEDGQLFAAIVWIPLVGAVYGLLRCTEKTGTSVGFHTEVVRFVVFECCAIAGMLISPQLTEMAGMLYLFVPLLVLVSAVVAGVVCVTWRLLGIH